MPKLSQQIKLISQRNGLILLYHFIDWKTPDGLLNTLHTVSPTMLKQHIECLSACFEFVSLQEFVDARSKRGLVTITFDDGYKNVIKNALPVLESFAYPATLFLNPMTFSKRWNWRDKIRYLIHHQLTEDFASQYVFNHKSGRFYRYSKHPQNNSALLDHALDKFLGNRQNDIHNSLCALYDGYPYMQTDDVIAHPLISFGNHSQNHYVLASLSERQQTEEIKQAQQCLQALPGLTLSECFSAPFGGDHDINSATFALTQAADYSALLMSRQRLQPDQSSKQKIQVLERFMPRSDDILSELVLLNHSTE